MHPDVLYETTDKNQWGAVIFRVNDAIFVNNKFYELLHGSGSSRYRGAVGHRQGIVRASDGRASPRLRQSRFEEEEEHSYPIIQIEKKASVFGYVETTTKPVEINANE